MHSAPHWAGFSWWSPLAPPISAVKHGNLSHNETYHLMVEVACWKSPCFELHESKWDNMDHGQCFICMLYIYIDRYIYMHVPYFFLYFHMHGQCSIWNMLIYINIYIYICTCPIGRYSKSRELTGSSSSAGFLDMWPWRRTKTVACHHWKTINIPWINRRILGSLEDYWIIGRTRF